MALDITLRDNGTGFDIALVDPGVPRIKEINGIDILHLKQYHSISALDIKAIHNIDQTYP